MLQNPNFRKLYETEKWILGYEFEDCYLFEIQTKKATELGSMYGNPNCGLIDKNNQWAITGGEKIFIWFNEKIYELDDKRLLWVHSIRQISPYEVEILIDPWSVHSAIWELNIKTKNKRKIRDFNNYKEKEYTENIIW